MSRTTSAATLAVLLALSCAWGGEQLVRITIFELQDGSEVQALRFATLETDGTTQYTITQLDGKKLKLSGAQIASRREAPVRLRDLPEAGQLEVQRAEEARAASAAEAKPAVDEQNPLKRRLVAAKLRENEVAANVKQLANELATAEAEADSARSAFRDLDRQVARAEAELRETRKEYQDERKRLAAREAGLRTGRDHAKDDVSRWEKRVDELRKDLKDARKKLEQAKAETARAYNLMLENSPAP